MNTIEDHWKKLEEIGFSDAPPVVKEAARRTFYCGAVAMFALVTGIYDHTDSEEAAQAMMKGWEDELAEFHKSMRR